MEINNVGYRSEVSEAMTENGAIVIENLVPDHADSEVMKKAETELYDVFSKYKKIAGQER